MGYERFRHFGKDKITMDFAFFAIAFNIKKMAEKGQRQGIIPINEGKSVHLNSSHKPKKHILREYCLDIMKIAA